jgi:hypothetical protein
MPLTEHSSSFVSPVYREQVLREIAQLLKKREFELARKAGVIANSTPSSLS